MTKKEFYGTKYSPNMKLKTDGGTFKIISVDFITGYFEYIDKDKTRGIHYCNVRELATTTPRRSPFSISLSFPESPATRMFSLGIFHR